jgi:hypothetical protein
MGKYLFMPDNDMDFNVVVGEPLVLPCISAPTAADVDKYHSLFIERYIALFNKHKKQYAAQGEEAELEIF